MNRFENSSILETDSNPISLIRQRCDRQTTLTISDWSQILQADASRRQERYVQNSPDFDKYWVVGSTLCERCSVLVISHNRISNECVLISKLKIFTPMSLGYAWMLGFDGNPSTKLGCMISSKINRMYHKEALQEYLSVHVCRWKYNISNWKKKYPQLCPIIIFEEVELW